jgi:hypothetical protein
VETDKVELRILSVLFNMHVIYEALLKRQERRSLVEDEPGNVLFCVVCRKRGALWECLSNSPSVLTYNV